MRTRFGSVALNCARQGWTYRVWSSHRMDECPLCASVFCKLLHRSVRMVRQRTLWAVCRQQRLRCTISRCHVFECVENPHGANFWFRRLKFTHATVLTLTNGNCCRKFRVGACSHSVRKVCVCRSIHAKCGCQGSVTFFGILFLT